ncbi:MAG: ABC transporter permease [Planctomycetota bacterium]|jgi:putative ABC transport system permease protein
MKKLLTIPIRLLRWMLASMLGHVQNIGTAVVQIWANKGRSVLTTLGVIIAVTSIITVVAIVEGYGAWITNMVQGYGTKYMVVHPYQPRGRHGAGFGNVTLDLADIEAVRVECDKIGRISPFVYTHDAEIIYGREKATEIPIRGVRDSYQVIRNFHADVGRFFGPVDIDNAQNVIVLGRTVMKLLEADESIVGEYVLLDGERFLVIGLLEEKGSLFGDDQDQTAMLPYSTAVNLYPERRKQMPFLAEATSEEDIPDAYQQIARVLRQRHGIQPGQADDFRINRQDQALSEFETVKNVASAILAGIVSISMVVGGIGIMNVMLVSVSERTREIGLRKSVGGRRRDIMLQFLTEAVVLCTLGGVIGVAFGYGISYVASLHPDMVDTRVPAWAVVLALGFSAGTGIIFGTVPAFKAAILHPIDALRHE